MAREFLFNEFMALIRRVQQEDPEILFECADALANAIGGKGRNRKTKQWLSVEAKMEKLYKSHWEWTPRRMAGTVRRYLQIPFTMMPKLIKTAQQVKRRMYMRKVRGGLDEGNLKKWDPEFKGETGKE